MEQQQHGRVVQVQIVEGVDGRDVADDAAPLRLIETIDTYVQLA
jgi:hypothetical protein